MSKVVYEQNTPSTTWTITHNLGKFVVHDVHIAVGMDYVKAFPANVTQTSNELVLTWSSPQAGRVIYASQS